MKIYSVIVGYHPNLMDLVRTCEILVADKSAVIIVDNTELSYLYEREFPLNCELIALDMNTGIAHGQNVGISRALECGAEVIAFFDQDSRFDIGFLSELTSNLRVGDAKIVSPLCFDDISGAELPSTRLTKWGLLIDVYKREKQTPYPVDIAISSGTAATKEVFQIGGIMDESLFIDLVDTEWCLRCRSKSIPIWVVPTAKMKHRVGGASIGLGFITVLVHSPIRCYYQIRNCLLLFRKRHIPRLFSIRETSATLLSRIILLLFVKNRFSYIKAYIVAILDGLRGVVGKKSN